MTFKRYLILFVIFGLLWLDMEVLMRVVTFEMPRFGMLDTMLGGKPLHPYLALFGFTSLWMFFVGGIAITLIGIINEINFIRKNFNVFFQSLLAAVIILIVEFFSGYLLNIKLGFNLWNYSEMPLNLMGQINLPFGFLWFTMCPFAFWLDDLLRKTLKKSDEPLYKLSDVYKKLFAVTDKPSLQSDR